MSHYAVALGLDEASRGRLAELERRLASMSGLETIGQLGETHHLSLGIYATLPPGFDGALAAFASSLPRQRLSLASVAVFPGARSVLFLAPVVTSELLDLHRRSHDALAVGAPHCWDHYRPGKWVPHVTLAMDVTPEVLPSALAIVAAAWQPGDVSLDELSLIEASPVRRLATYSL